jgi:asparagine synthase (glutamine-hydrolysing)
MFAFGIWDRQANKLILARDRFGIKPLYYYTTPAIFVFASEVRSLLESGLVPRKLSAAGTDSYLRFGAIQAPLSIIEGVRSLMPGHYLSIEPTQAGWHISDAAYAEDLPEADPDGGVSDRAQAAKRLRSILEDSIKAHLVSDVPVAAFLSGGIDSSTVVGLMSQVSGEPPRTFTVVFEEKEFSEESYARQVAERFGAKHHEVALSETSLLQMLPQTLAAMDQPTIDGINTYVISKAVAETGIKVALSGLGSDELFGGYPTFRRTRQLRNLALVPEPVRRTTARTGQTLLGRSVKQRKAWSLLAQGGTPLATYTLSRQLFSREEVAALTNRDPGIDSMEVASPLSKLAGELNAMSDYEMRGYMANMLLRDTDHMSMAHSLEVRVPFLDSRVVSFVLGLPDEWKLDGGRPKPLLLDAIEDLLPEAVWRRPKMGFTLPFQRWMHSALHQDLAGTFNNNGGLSHLGITDFAGSVWKTFDRTPRLERWSRPWSLYILKTWCEINSVTL